MYIVKYSCAHKLQALIYDILASNEVHMYIVKYSCAHKLQALVYDILASTEVHMYIVKYSCAHKLQALVYDILPLEEGARKRCSEYAVHTGVYLHILTYTVHYDEHQYTLTNTCTQWRTPVYTDIHVCE